MTSRKGKRRAPAEEEDQQLEPSRARKGNSDGQWRVQEKYGLTPNMMALYMSVGEHNYTLSNFPYAEAIMAWRAAAPTRGRYGSKN